MSAEISIFVFYLHFPKSAVLLHSNVCCFWDALCKTEVIKNCLQCSTISFVQIELTSVSCLKYFLTNNVVINRQFSSGKTKQFQTMIFFSHLIRNIVPN